MSLSPNFWKRSEQPAKPAIALLCGMLALSVAPAAVPAATPANPDQDRAALIKYLQKRLPGSGPADWTLGMAANVAGVNVMPLSPEYSTSHRLKEWIRFLAWGE